MKIIKITKDDLVLKGPLKTLSPSSFGIVRDKCAYQALFPRLRVGKSVLLPPTKAIILGNVVHKIYEKVTNNFQVSCVELIQLWDELILYNKKVLEKKYPDIKIDINDFDKRNKTIQNALKIGKSKQTGNESSGATGDYSFCEEKVLDCSDIGLKGTADKIVEYNNLTDIIDYKSGQVLDVDGKIKEEYKLQLKLYALMYLHLYPEKKIRSLSLVDNDGAFFDVNFEEKELEELKGSVALYLENINKRIDNPETLMKPDPKYCPNCTLRHFCAKAENGTSGFYTLKGKVVEVVSPNYWKVKTDKDELFSVSGLDIVELDDIQQLLGKTISFVNLVRSSETDNNIYIN